LRRLCEVDERSQVVWLSHGGSWRCGVRLSVARYVPILKQRLHCKVLAREKQIQKRMLPVAQQMQLRGIFLAGLVDAVMAR